MQRSIGNDIIDLRFVEPPLHRRYAERVLSAGEVATVGENVVLLQVHWAAKEAAFKALRRLFPGFTFSPRSLILSMSERCIRFKSLRLPCHIEIQDDLVFIECATSFRSLRYHTRTWIGAITNQRRMSAMPHDFADSTHYSLISRDYVCEQVAKLLGVDPGCVRVTGGGKGGTAKPPLLEVQENGHTSRAYPLSFTHHGRFSGISLLCHTETAEIALARGDSRGGPLMQYDPTSMLVAEDTGIGPHERGDATMRY